MSFTYKFAILGGTFDHFHVGHEQFIGAAFDEAENVTIGIVDKLGLSDKIYPNSIENYSQRIKNVQFFLESKNLLRRSKIIPLYDIYGTSLIDNTIESIFVTESTKAGADKINIERIARGMTQLPIVVVPYATGDDGITISSGRIREGIINRLGISFLKFFLQKEKYSLPANLRSTLQQPMGVVISNVQEITKLIPSTSVVIAVGDIVSLNLKEIHYPTAINIIDYKTRREEIDKKVVQKYFGAAQHSLDNPPGTINPKIAKLFLSSLATYHLSKDPQVIAVNGEEDLLALPAILLSPLESYIIYGQHNVGMVVVKVTEATKNIAKNYLEQF